LKINPVQILLVSPNHKMGNDDDPVLFNQVLGDIAGAVRDDFYRIIHEIFWAMQEMGISEDGEIIPSHVFFGWKCEQSRGKRN